MEDNEDPKPLNNWTDKDITYLKEHYGITSMVEFAKKLNRHPANVHLMARKLQLRENMYGQGDPDNHTRMMIFQMLNDHKRYLPNGWLVGLAMSRNMIRSLVHQIDDLSTDLEEIEEEINAVLDAIVEGYDFVPLFNVGDMLKGADHGQAYRITGREFIPNSKMLTYYFTYLYGGDDIPEEYDDEEDWDDGDDEGLNIRLHNN
jgi:hypothetical protein